MEDYLNLGLSGAFALIVILLVLAHLTRRGRSVRRAIATLEQMLSNKPADAPILAAPIIPSENSMLADRLIAVQRHLDDQISRIVVFQEKKHIEVLQTQTIAFAGVNEKLNRLGAAVEVLAPTPLHQWSFRQYRAEYDRWSRSIKKASEDDQGRPKPGRKNFVVDAGELKLAAELLLVEHEVGLIRWVVSHKLQLSVLMPAMVGPHAVFGVYLPIVIAVMHFVEVQHVHEQQRQLGHDTSYLIGIHEEASQASLRLSWRKARDLLLAINLADARMQLNALCSDLVEFRHKQLSESILEFNLAVQNVGEWEVANTWMHRCLKSLERLKDAIVLECFVRAALGETGIFITGIVDVERESIRETFIQYRNAIRNKLKSIYLQRRRARLYLRTAPMRLLAYGRLLDFIRLSEDLRPKPELPEVFEQSISEAVHTTGNRVALNERAH